MQYYKACKERQIMDIVTLECPNCGGRVERENNDYFATCPYCGVEV